MGSTRKRLRGACAAMLACVLAASFMPVGALADSGPGGDAGGMGGADTSTFDYTGTYTGVIVADGEAVSGETGATYAATDVDQNAALSQNGGALTLAGVTLTKTGSDSDGDSCNFYGVNSILLAVNEGSTAVVSDTTLTADSEGSNGIFATDSATVFASEVSISTTDDNSRGLDATYDGLIVAADVTISTTGDHCAGVATDRGGGTINVNGASISTAGEGSPVLYSTGDVQANAVTGTATGSQLIGMEGANTVLVNNSTLTSNITRASASDPVADGVIIYQSTSGDADTSTGDAATFQVANSTFTSAIASGAMFYLTNTTADMVLYNSTFDFDADAANLILAAGNNSNNWGSAGSNGADVTVTALDQQLAGVIEADTISSVTLYLADGSTWTGCALISDNAYATSSTSGIFVNVDATSTWVVDEDCTISSLTVAEGGQVVDAEGLSATIVAGGQTVVEGASSTTVTVTGDYSTDYDEDAEGSLSTDLVDRTDFDETFGGDTSWSMTDESASTGDGDTTGDGDGTDDDGAEDGDDAEEPVEVTFIELAGSTRYGTCAAIVAQAYAGQTSDYVVMASGSNFPDALSAAALAGVLDAPVVLLNSSNVQAAADVVDSLGATNVYLVGGTSVIRPYTASLLKIKTDATVTRIWGQTRQETAVAVAQEVASLAGDDASDTCFVASGAKFPDALSASAYSYWSGSPVFLAQSDGSVSDSTLSAIEEGGFSRIVVLGGESAVGAQAFEDLSALAGATVERVGGETRYETSAEVAAWSVSEGMSWDGAAIATGATFPDALCGATQCGRTGSVLLLASESNLTAVERLAQSGEVVTTIYYLGGTSALSEQLRAEVEAIVEG